jgi:hypothetical protein
MKNFFTLILILKDKNFEHKITFIYSSPLQPSIYPQRLIDLIGYRALLQVLEARKNLLAARVLMYS